MIQFCFTGDPYKRRRLKKTAVPTLFAWTSAPSATAVARARRCESRQDKHDTFSESSVKATTDEPPADEFIAPDIGAECTAYTSITASSEYERAEEPQCKEQPPVMTDATTEPQSKALFSVFTFIKDSEGIHHFTGLEHYDRFKFVFDSLGPAVHHLNYIYGPIPSNIFVEDIFF